VARILLGVSGSIAAYKAADLCSRLVKAGHEVTVVMTRGATELVGPLTFATLTARPVLTNMWEREEWARVEHIDLTDRADLVVVAPATANLLGKAAHGIADDMLTTVLLAAAAPVLCCPAMNPRMWANPLVRENVARLRKAGWRFLEPGEGTVACGHTGQGRMREPAEIHEEIERLTKGAGRGRGRGRGRGKGR
jgi:phosphopantothenoylcysteine decarboxylase/phosphopantothenate--cysteine ligase